MYINDIKSPIELEQEEGNIYASFEEIMYPLVKDDVSKLLRFSTSIRPFKKDEVFNEGDHLRYGKDVKGFPLIYKSTTSHVAQLNILPGTEEANIYELIGYYNGYRVWSRPFGSKSSYNMNEIVPHYIANDYPAVQYVRGNSVTKDTYVISPDNLVYKVVPNSIVMNTDAVPFTNTMVYTVIPEATVKDTETVTIAGYTWFKSLKDDNRFEPTVGSVIWEVLDEADVPVIVQY